MTLLLWLFAALPTMAQAQDADSLPSFVMTVGVDDALPNFTDEELWQRGVKISFKVNKTNINPKDPGYRSLIDALHNVPDGYTFCRLLVIRGSASPEGPVANNTWLAQQRAQSLVDSLRRYVTLPATSIEERFINEDYFGLARMLEKSSFKYRDQVIDIINNSPDAATTKKRLRSLNRGRVWETLLRDYFPTLRATRVVMVISRKPYEIPKTVTVVEVPVTPPQFEVRPTLIEEPSPVVIEKPAPRRELWAVKTNLLFYGAYVPQYGWCPMPNIEVEYLPKHGHWTWAGSFDMPWWQSSAYNDRTTVSTGKNHKFFQVRNYQLMARWYSHRGDGADGFHGFYMYPYVNVTVYGIGFTNVKGWMGEAYGGGLGLGWKIPLGKLRGKDGFRTRGSHWYLELGLQAGGFYTRYDPYVWGNPINGSTADGHYYYRYTGSPSLFHKRDHDKVFFGPTRVSITIAYDLIYRSRKASSRKGGAR